MFGLSNSQFSLESEKGNENNNVLVQIECISTLIEINPTSEEFVLFLENSLKNENNHIKEKATEILKKK